MIDTIKLKINNFNLVNSQYFTSISDYTNSYGFCKTIKTIESYRKQLIKNGQYAPRVTIEGTNGKEILVLELSLPKLIFGTNLIELKQNDFDIVIDGILYFLSSAGIETDRNDIKNALVTKIAFPKNIDVTPIGTAHQIIKLLAELGKRPNYDYDFFNNFNTRKNGFGLRHSSDSMNFTIYDKMSEMLHNPTTRTEKQILIDWENKRQYCRKEITRFELTLRNKKAIKQVMEKIFGVRKNDYTLSELFDASMSSYLLVDKFKELYNNPLISKIELNSIWSRITKEVDKTPSYNYNRKAVIKTALFDIITMGYDKFKKNYINQTSRSSWQRIKKDLRPFLEILPKSLITSHKFSAQEVKFYIDIVLHQ